jgi:hypothetical protein
MPGASSEAATDRRACHDRYSVASSSHLGFRLGLITSTEGLGASESGSSLAFDFFDCRGFFDSRREGTFPAIDSSRLQKLVPPSVGGAISLRLHLPFVVTVSDARASSCGTQSLPQLGECPGPDGGPDVRHEV